MREHRVIILTNSTVSYFNFLLSRQVKDGQMREPIRPIYLCNKKVGNCVSTMMGNGGAVVAQVFLHKYQDPQKFTPTPMEVKAEL